MSHTYLRCHLQLVSHRRLELNEVPPSGVSAVSNYFFSGRERQRRAQAALVPWLAFLSPHISAAAACGVAAAAQCPSAWRYRKRLASIHANASRVPHRVNHNIFTKTQANPIRKKGGNRIFIPLSPEVKFSNLQRCRGKLVFVWRCVVSRNRGNVLRLMQHKPVYKPLFSLNRPPNPPNFHLRLQFTISPYLSTRIPSSCSPSCRLFTRLPSPSSILTISPSIHSASISSLHPDHLAAHSLVFLRNHVFATVSMAKLWFVSTIHSQH
jgi:hypothetical protein